jgi:hypothetical protein
LLSTTCLFRRFVQFDLLSNGCLAFVLCLCAYSKGCPDSKCLNILSTPQPYSISRYPSLPEAQRLTIFSMLSERESRTSVSIDAASHFPTAPRRPTFQAGTTVLLQPQYQKRKGFIEPFPFHVKEELEKAARDEYKQYFHVPNSRRAKAAAASTKTKKSMVVAPSRKQVARNSGWMNWGISFFKNARLSYSSYIID